MTRTISRNFHNYADAELVHFLPKHLDAGVFTTTKSKHIIIQEREVSYRFYPHAHPFVRALIKRLIEKAVSELQAADTDYQKNADGSLATLPEGTFKPVL